MDFFFLTFSIDSYMLEHWIPLSNWTFLVVLTHEGNEEHRTLKEVFSREMMVCNCNNRSLETEVGLLVYEFVTNWTLSNHIHDDQMEESLINVKCLDPLCNCQYQLRGWTHKGKICNNSTSKHSSTFSCWLANSLSLRFL